MSLCFDLAQALLFFVAQTIKRYDNEIQCSF